MSKSIAKSLVNNYQVRLIICQMAVAFRDFGIDIWQLLSCYLKMGSYVQLAFTLMWYKVNYPELYLELAIL